MKAFDMVTAFRKDHSRDKENQYIAKALTILQKTWPSISFLKGNNFQKQLRFRKWHQST